MKKFRIPHLISFGIFFLACQKEDVLTPKDSIPNAESVITTEPELPPGDLIVLGDQVDSPYSV